jgi:hypothetical protein
MQIHPLRQAKDRKLFHTLSLLTQNFLSKVYAHPTKNLRFLAGNDMVVHPYCLVTCPPAPVIKKQWN